MEWLADQFEHPLTGITFWDLIQPAHVHVGSASVRADWRRRTAHVRFLFVHLPRALMLIALSNLFSNFGEDRVQLQLINVLSQIAFGYVICFLILQLQPAWQVASGVLLLAVQWALFAMFPGPQGAFSHVGNIGQVIDRAVLGYTYQGYYVTINFIGNAVVILFGCWTGLLLRARRPPAVTLKALGAATVAACLIGLALSPFNPWSSACGRRRSASSARRG